MGKSFFSIQNDENTEGPFYSILKDRLVDERIKLLFRFSLKKISNFGKLKITVFFV
jgi:hypothetical protein